MEVRKRLILNGGKIALKICIGIRDIIGKIDLSFFLELVLKIKGTKSRVFMFFLIDFLIMLAVDIVSFPHPSCFLLKHTNFNSVIEGPSCFSIIHDGKLIITWRLIFD